MARRGAVDITKETVMTLKPAPWPKEATLIQARTGKVKKAGLGGEITSAIYKKEHDGPLFCDATGLEGDDHAAKSHGGTERAVHQYNPEHYEDWQTESVANPHLYDTGSFGENIATTNLSEDNVCIGDIYQLGGEVLLEVSEPRHPCYKLNARFEWPRMLKRTIQTGRSGWNMRVLKTGMICKGDKMVLLKRPYPKWSVLNVQRVTRGKHVALTLLSDCIQLPMTELWLDIASTRLRRAQKRYTLVDAELVTPRVRRLTFHMKETLVLTKPEFDPYAFAMINFGPDGRLSRSYSIVDGDLHQFSIAVSLDQNSRGGSAYLHQELKIGDEITMAPGDNPRAQENDKKCDEGLPLVLIVGGIGITAFLPSIRRWESKGLSWHLHYAVRSAREAAFLDRLPKHRTTLYVSEEGQRLNVQSVIPKLDTHGNPKARIFSCGPRRMMQECSRITDEHGYQEHMVHYEDFGSGEGGDFGEPFDVEVFDPDENRHENLTVPANKSLLDVLTEVGFDVTSSCLAGACGACKVTLCKGEVDYRSTCLLSNQKGHAVQSCVDRGIGKIKIEID
ncbi:MOSC domain-containing protein [Microdochium trichocladiopsis]|uniref:MOSC domain-containing protein n=1 Tax=Microdochium trichocladiopsis TaxID=1682393 RepID=A0A9P8YK55_9PEZI|nr:MOSC domain-containing protein [Microdochium trichocladiopsis]KAH7041513.1 MOSC domain-containing protein [Microdochium trichocladiopsis]